VFVCMCVCLSVFFGRNSNTSGLPFSPKRFLTLNRSEEIKLLFTVI